MKTNNFETELQKQLESLPKEKPPQRDLWKGVELGLEAPHHAAARRSSGSSFKWIGIAASFALVVLVGWFGLQENAPHQSDKVISGEALVQALSQQHEDQKQALLVKFEGHEAFTQNWQQQLTELDEAAGAIKAALKQDPDNTALLQMLQNVYQQQILLIERVHAPKWQQI
ncbi:hypothetical protein CA267_011515 [Alteromonas pelagimontana]|uniref:Uncharacterized protein n=1 Tax=Alteromonas pelagimontana TaxID=1858656 RepID=A0A6M4MFC7_9ALTE|nr:hypothetical protein [Alteromonas pelagimontana]QJR81360.1 hypothetical protein CA267_011515 [Alteromonas pelagimontana]